VKRPWLVALLAAPILACPPAAPPVTPKVARDSAAASARDSVLAQRLARLELRLAERDAQIEDLNARLDEARQEVVRAMSKLQTLASRAEAASAMAEAEIAVQANPDATQAATLLKQSGAEFAKQNYGGSLYLANQAKSVTGVSRSRLGGAERPVLRQGEAAFAVPLRLQAVTRGRLREGPGGAYRVLLTLAPGAPLTGYSTLDQWVRVGDDAGHTGWVLVTVVGRRESDP
jgi:uncharacterized coiled-coil protein SlyX